MPADLHTHSNLSDGTDSPEDLVRMAKDSGLTIVALTDHDNVDGIEKALSTGSEVKIEVVPGIEFTTEVEGAEIHILGYFIDYKNPKLLEKLNTIQQARTDRIHETVKKLNNLGVKISAEDVFEIAKNKTPGRPHVARAMIKSGVVSNFKEAFVKYLDFWGPAYVSHYKLAPEEAIRLICEVGGVAVFAHPAVSNRDDIIPDLMSAGLKGIEVFYPTHNPSQISRYKKLSAKYGLHMTGGTDFHGLNSGRDIKFGDYTIPDELVDKLRAARPTTQ